MVTLPCHPEELGTRGHHRHQSDPQHLKHRDLTPTPLHEPCKLSLTLQRGALPPGFYPGGNIPALGSTVSPWERGPVPRVTLTNCRPW